MFYLQQAPRLNSQNIIKPATIRAELTGDRNKLQTRVNISHLTQHKQDFKNKHKYFFFFFKKKMEEHDSLLKSSLSGGAQSQSQKKGVNVEDLVLARNCFFLWTFVGYASWGVVVELYTNFFYDVINNGNYGDVSYNMHE